MIGGGFQNIFKIPELKKRILFTLALLIVYRIGVHVPVPGIDSLALASFFKQAEGTIFGIVNMFSGGAFEKLSVFALGIMPYISASIILQLLTVVVPHLEQLKKEGEQGRKKITQYTRYGTVVLSIIQGFGISVGLESMSSPGGAPVVLIPGWAFRLMTVITLTAGTAFIMWLGEQITERGIGNGISLIIFAGIVCRLPIASVNTGRLLSTGEMGIFAVLILVVLMVGCHRVYHLCRTGTASHTRSVCQTGGRTPDVWWAEHPSAAEDKYFRSYSADFRFIHYYVSGYHRQFCKSGMDSEYYERHHARQPAI